MMYLLKSPTGNQSIPSEVSQAKLVNNEIKLKADIATARVQMILKTKIQKMEANLFLMLKKCPSKKN
jgi:hypothetical protein